MKHILIVTPFFAPHIGGSQQYMEDLYAVLLKEHPELSVDVLCYNTDKAGETEVYRGMHVNRVSCLNILPGQFALPNPMELVSFLWKKRKSYDLIHVSTRFFDTAWYMPIFATLTKTPIVLTDHCAFHPVHNNRVVSGVSKLLDLTLVRFCMKWYTTIFATNKATQAFLKDVLGIKSTVMYGGVATDTFVPQKKKETKKLTITYVGRMIPSKGVQLLFDVATLHPEFDFVFAGPGELVKPLQERVQKEKLNFITIKGGQSKKEVIRLLKSTDIFVHPSYHHEGFPNIILEAGAMRLAVIATNTGGTREMILDKKTGILLPMKDTKGLEKALVSLGSNKKERETLSQNLYTHIQENFSWKEISKQMYSYLQRGK